MGSLLTKGIFKGKESETPKSNDSVPSTVSDTTNNTLDGISNAQVNENDSNKTESALSNEIVTATEDKSKLSIDQSTLLTEKLDSQQDHQERDNYKHEVKSLITEVPSNEPYPITPDKTFFQHTVSQSPSTEDVDISQQHSDTVASSSTDEEHRTNETFPKNPDKTFLQSSISQSSPIEDIDISQQHVSDTVASSSTDKEHGKNETFQRYNTTETNNTTNERNSYELRNKTEISGTPGYPTAGANYGGSKHRFGHTNGRGGLDALGDSRKYETPVQKTPRNQFVFEELRRYQKLFPLYETHSKTEENATGYIYSKTIHPKSYVRPTGNNTQLNRNHEVQSPNVTAGTSISLSDSKYNQRFKRNYLKKGPYKDKAPDIVPYELLRFVTSKPFPKKTPE